MTNYEAVEIAEGFGAGEDASYAERVEAWQLLIDTGMAWQLQGWFGRQANNLIEKGICHDVKIGGTI